MATSVATTIPAPVFHPTVWGDYFINFTPEPLQAGSYTPSIITANHNLVFVLLKPARLPLSLGITL